MSRQRHGQEKEEEEERNTRQGTGRGKAHSWRLGLEQVAGSNAPDLWQGLWPCFGFIISR